VAELGQYTDIRQILIETHDWPKSKSTVTKWGKFPAMKASDCFDAFKKQAGFVLFSKEVVQPGALENASSGAISNCIQTFWGIR
jgi:hypothetical protein